MYLALFVHAETYGWFNCPSRIDVNRSTILFWSTGDNPFGKEEPRGEELKRENGKERQVTQQMIRQIRAEDERGSLHLKERRSEYAGQRNMRGMIRQIREQEEARKRGN